MRIAIAAVVLAVCSNAYADGERTPMIGGSLIAASEHDRGDVAGVGLETTFWWGRIGLAAEGAQRADIESGLRTSTLGASARILVLDQLWPSLLEPRDVEAGLELHAVIERAWSDAVDAGVDPSVRYGVGIAARLRGGGDFDDQLLAESRLFVRVMWPHSTGTQAIARGDGSVMQPSGVMLIIGLGAAWGAGDRHYSDRFRMRTTEVVDWGQIRIER